MSMSSACVSITTSSFTAPLTESCTLTQPWVKLWSALCLSALAIPWKPLYCRISSCGEVEYVSLARAVGSENEAQTHEETQRGARVLEHIHKPDMLMSVGLVIIKQKIHLAKAASTHWRHRNIKAAQHSSYSTKERICGSRAAQAIGTPQGTGFLQNGLMSALRRAA